jgi:hypothetical protein
LLDRKIWCMSRIISHMGGNNCSVGDLDEG